MVCLLVIITTYISAIVCSLRRNNSPTLRGNMDFIDQIKRLAEKIPTQLEHIKTEAATRNALVEPFIKALGYDTSDLTEVVPEFGADLDVPGVPKNKKIDYAILKNGKPIMLIECKAHNDKLMDGYKQLFHYAVTTDTRIGILTNGLIYKFYADLNKPGKLDEVPFLEINMLALKEPLVAELKSLVKTSLSIDEMLIAANELKYTGGILAILTEQLTAPSDDFVKIFFQQLCPGRAFAGAAKQQFTNFTGRALKQFIREQINSLLDASAMGTSNPSSISLAAQTNLASTFEEEVKNSQRNSSQVITTEEELEGFYIVKSILRQRINPDRIIHRDVASYFSILLDDTNRKPICRLYFNSSNKRIGIFETKGGEKQETKIAIESLNDIYKYAVQLEDIVCQYDL